MKKIKSPLIALVKGGSTGIGKAICERLAQQGSVVYINYQSQPKSAKQLALKIKRDGGTAFIVQANIGYEKQVEKMFEKIFLQYKKIDILVNNAGIEGHAPFLNIKTKDWDTVMTTNLRGTFLCSRAAAQIMSKNKSGSIVNTSSVHESIPWGGYAHYCTSKAAMTMLAKAMALELARHNVRVNNVSPGATATPINDNWIHKSKLKKLVLDKIPLSRIGTAEEVAAAVAYLVSHEARYITDTSLFIDGGMLLYSSFLKQG